MALEVRFAERVSMLPHLRTVTVPVFTAKPIPAEPAPRNPATAPTAG